MNIAEKKEKQKIDPFLMVLFLASATIVWCLLNRISSLASAAFTGSFVLLVVWFGKMVLVDGRNRFLAVVFVIVVTSTVCVIVSAMLAEEEMSMAYFTDHLVFLSTILFLFVIMNIDINPKTCYAILGINVVMAYMYPFAYRFLPQETKFQDLYLNFSNPNLTGMWLLQAVLYASVAVLLLKPIWIRVLAAISIPINIWLITKTGARNCLVALIVFGFLCGWAVVKQQPRYSKFWLLLINLLPIIFVPIYLTYVEVVIDRGWLDFLAGEGKNLDSRVWIWRDRFESLENLWVIGNYVEKSGNSHNSHLVLLVSYGVFGLVLGTYFLYSVCAEANQNIRSRKNMYALTAFFAVIFMGLGEGALFAGGVGIFIPACGFLLLAKCDFGEDKPVVLPWSKKVMTNPHGH